MFLGLALVLGGACSSGGTSGNSGSLKDVTIAFGNPAQSLGVPEGYLAAARGWWKQEGYNVKVVPNQGTQAATQVLIAGHAQFLLGNTAPPLAAAAKDLAKMRLVATTFNTQWRMVTLKDGGVTDLKALKGKKIGIPVAGSGGAAYLDSYLASAGLSSTKDVQQVVVGFGASAFQALESGNVAALFDILSDVNNATAQGKQFNLLFDAQWLQYPDYGLTTTDEIAKKDPKMVEAIARGLAKSMVFLTASPSCVVDIFNKQNGSGSGGGLTREQQVKALEAQVPQRASVLEAGGGQYWVRVPAEGLTSMQAFLVSKNQLVRSVPADDLIISDPDFSKKVNAFDRAAVEAEAKSCKS